MKVTVTITAVTTDGNEKDSTTQTVQGFLRACDNSLEIAYREPSGEESLGNTRTFLRLFTDRMELSRQGDYGGMLTMEAGRTHSCEYTTPFGPMMLDVTASAYHHDMDAACGGTMRVCYALAAGGDSTTHELCVTAVPVI